MSSLVRFFFVHANGNPAIFLIRLAVGLIFFTQGILKFTDPALGVVRFTRIGFAHPGPTAHFVGIFEIACGLLVLVGLWTRFASVPLLIVILTAIVTTKIPELSRANQGFWFMVSDARTDFAMLCCLLFLIASGAGTCSLDAVRKRRVFGLIALAGFIAFGIVNPLSLHAQTPPAQTSGDNAPSFEVSSVKKHPPASDPEKAMGFRMGGPEVSRYRASNVTAKMLIAAAYGVQEFQIAGGPSWISSERWDIDAKVDDSLAVRLQKLSRRQQQEQQDLMLRSLLFDRFRLKVTRATKEGGVLALVVAKGGAKLKEVAPPDPHTPGPPPGSIGPERSSTPPAGQALVMMNNSVVTLASNAVPIAELAKQVSQQMGIQIVDQTGLKGTYEYRLRFAPWHASSTLGEVDTAAENNTPSIFTALQEQLGLRLVSSKAPIDTITIDDIEEPTPN